MIRRRRFVAVLATLLLVLGMSACEVNGGAGPTDADLQAMLLTEDDVPVWFSQHPGDLGDEEDDVSSDLTSSDPTCEKALDVFDEDATEPSASVSFVGLDGEVILHQVDALPEATEELIEFMTAFRSSCNGKVDFEDGEITEATLELVKGTSVGDKAGYLRLNMAGTLDGEEVEVTGYVVAIANDDVVQSVMTLAYDVPAHDIDGDPPMLAQAEQLAAAAQERYEAAVD